MLLIVEAGPILGVDFLLPMYAISSMITLKALDIGARSYSPFGLPARSTQEESAMALADVHIWASLVDSADARSAFVN